LENQGDNMKLGFIGVGNMGGAILKGYLSANGEKSADISIFDTSVEKTAEFTKAGCYACDNIGELVKRSDFIIIGVKPNIFEIVLPEIAKEYEASKVLVSIAAGITMSYIGGFVGKNAKVIRTMPNTPALVLEAMTAICRNGNITDDDMKSVENIFSQVGKIYEIPESLIHCAIGVSGSSPAYTYMYIDALATAAEENGLDRQQALVCAAQSVLGAAKMVLEGDVDPVQLRINVCSPGGTTIEAVQKLQESKFEEIVKDGFQAAVDKSKKMAE